MKTWIICIAGFSEKRGAHTGTSRLYMRLREWTAPETTVRFWLWDEDWRDRAAHIARVSPPDARILVCAYSWGAGHGFVRLSRALQRLGRRVETAVLCDPVYRSRTLLGRWLAIVPWLRVRVPANVDDVLWLRQRTDLPSGHTPKALGPETWIHPAVDLTGLYTHARIDDSSEYHALAASEARRILSKPPRRAEAQPETQLHD